MLYIHYTMYTLNESLLLFDYVVAQLKCTETPSELKMMEHKMKHYVLQLCNCHFMSPVSEL